MSKTATDATPVWVDVGGTFTDCFVWPVGSPQPEVFKLLSSSLTKGRVASIDDGVVRDEHRVGDAADFWAGATFRLLASDGSVRSSTLVSSSNSNGEFRLSAELSADAVGLRYELVTGEPAPVLAVRRWCGTPLGESLPPVSMKLGTTRGTNALLTRTGSRTALVTTAGFGDALRIGDQARPELFTLDVHPREPLFATVREIDERVAADGSVLRGLDEPMTRAVLRSLRDDGFDSVAVVLLHAWSNPTHEARVAAIAHEIGFGHVSTSRESASVMRLVPRGETTVLDAYLSPVLSDYLAEITRRLGAGSKLEVMTSAGALVPAARFSGKDSLLSGPAGGMVGVLKVARETGKSAAIGFDMGGTSTDVCRCEEELVRRSESVQDGVRVHTPMLKVETVAAGGGSVCGFSGGLLTVGPDSAGAFPGPACYGNGGPLTVTDLNVHLNRVPAEEFPFPLDRDAIADRLSELLRKLDGAGQSLASPEELATGLLDIADATMCRAVERLTTHEGVSPGEHLLVSFGGAGGQHACRIAERLGIDDVIIPVHAGVLSAWGIGHAERREIAETPLQRLLAEIAADDWQSSIATLDGEAWSRLQRDTETTRDTVRMVVTADIRVAGQEATLTVPADDRDAVARHFAQAHQARYGYRHRSDALEVVTLRVELIATRSEDQLPGCPTDSRTPNPSATTAMFSGGTRRTTDIYRRANLRAGNWFDGPAILCEPTSTVVIDVGWRATLDASGHVRLARIAMGTDNSVETQQASGVADPISVELTRNRFAAIAEQMGEALSRTALSTNVKERLDYSCAVFEADGSLIANAPHVPVHLGAMSETIRALLTDAESRPGRLAIRAGDLFVSNDPFRGGSHLPDVTVMTPVYDAGGALRFWTASRAHHAEIGGITPGSMPPISRSLADEGVLIRTRRLCESGQLLEAEMRSLLKSGPHPSRDVDSNLADLTAQVAANEQGATLLRQLLDQEKSERLALLVAAVRRNSREQVLDALSRFRGRTLQFTDHLDDGSPIVVRVDVTPEAVTLDFAGTGEVLATNLNANTAIVRSATMYVLRCLVGTAIPLNAGVLDAVTLHIPTGLLNPPAAGDPQECAAVVGGNVETSQRVVDVLLGAFGVAAASQGTMNNLTFGDDSFGYYETIGGGAGATERNAGGSGVHTHMTNTRLTDVESLEHRYPVRVVHFGLRHGSGGQGRYSGGDGIVRVLEFLRPVTVSLLTERRTEYAPYGVSGGGSGTRGRNRLLRVGTEDWIDLGGKASVAVNVGDRLSIETPGGGGWGEPTENETTG